jgi:glycosyltransferase involved in cell wall biosynthesis
MKVFCYFVEPASYTLDLASNVYDKNKISYCFIKSTTLVKSVIKSKKIFLDNLSIIDKLIFLLDIYRMNDFIIVNGYNNYPFIMTFILNAFSSKKRYIACESDTQLSVPKNLLKRFAKQLYLSVVFSSKFVLGFAGGSNSHKNLFRSYGMKESRIFLMPMMVNNSKFHFEDKVFPNIFTFLFVGRLVKHKNVEGLIKQFNQNFFQKNACLKIIGSGDEEQYLKQKYSSDEVIFLGKLFDDDLIDEFKNASCLVLPSEFEPWGLVVNEALASGLPVIITSHVGANFDLINGRNTGFAVEDMNEFGNKMLELYINSNLLTQFSKNACNLMKDHWNYDFYNKCLNDVFKKLKKWAY